MITEQPTALPLSERLAYTPEEVTQLLPMSIKSVYEALNGGRLRGRRMTARRWLISRASLDAFMNGEGDDAGE